MDIDSGYTYSMIVLLTQTMSAKIYKRIVEEMR